MQRHSVSIVGGPIVDTTTEDGPYYLASEVDAEIERLKNVYRELENLYVQQGAIYEGISELLTDGHTSDFMLSFPIVSQVADLLAEIALKQACIDGTRRDTKEKISYLEERACCLPSNKWGHTVDCIRPQPFITHKDVAEQRGAEIERLTAQVTETERQKALLLATLEADEKDHEWRCNEIERLTRIIEDMKTEWKASICIPCEVSVCDVKNKNYRYQQDIAALQAEANRTMKELCEARGERDKLKEKVAYLQKDNTERYARIKELEVAAQSLMDMFIGVIPANSYVANT